MAVTWLRRTLDLKSSVSDPLTFNHGRTRQAAVDRVRPRQADFAVFLTHDAVSSKDPKSLTELLDAFSNPRAGLRLRQAVAAPQCEFVLQPRKGHSCTHQSPNMHFADRGMNVTAPISEFRLRRTE